MNLFKINKRQNIISAMLSLLKVKFTVKFAEQYYNEHPHKFNLLGISKILTDYGVENLGLKVSDKASLSNFETPFIAQSSNDFVIIREVTESHVKYLWARGEETITLNEFYKIWSGVLLLVEPTENAGEPNYRENIRKERFGVFQKSVLGLLLLFLCTNAVLLNPFRSNVGYFGTLCTNLIGFSLGLLLVLKQIKIQGDYADKICSLFTKHSCNSLLETSAAKFMGIIGWSEIGLSFFTANLVVLFFFPALIPYYALACVLALPYTLWSIWYQKKVAKQWCALCMMVQAVVWLTVLINLLSGFSVLPSFQVSKVAMIVCVYALPLICLGIILPKFIELKKLNGIGYELKSLRLNQDLFFSTLKEQAYYDVDRRTSSILFGNKDAELLITVLTNPHCNPCSIMHKRIETLLNGIGKRACIQYIFSYFKGGDEDSFAKHNKMLIGLYLKHESIAAKTIYDNWFSGGKDNHELFFRVNPINSDENLIAMEFNNHEAWLDRTGLRTTPTILVNGYALPKNYKVEDLEYFV